LGFRDHPWLMTIPADFPIVMTDDQLWRLSCAGDREAFGQLVERYQSLLCSLAYSHCGDLARSEDLAQDTFVIAWRRLGELREPAKLRAWLCGIVRNLAANASRREWRRGGPAEPLEAIPEQTTPEEDPAAQAVTHEEAALLWRSLAGLSATYREPMVLFYRQGRSVAEVAQAMELTEEAVKQRLTRGRAMLRDELATLVETTLVRTKPGSAFTLGVLVALPVIAGSATPSTLAAGVVMGGGAGAAGKGILAKMGLSLLVGPVIGMACAYLGIMAAASTTRSQEERHCVLRYARWIIAFCMALSLGLAGVLVLAGTLYEASAAWIVLGVSLWTVVLVGGILLICRRLDQDVRRIRVETNTGDAAYSLELAARGKSLRGPRYFESKTRWLGLPLVALAWGGASSDAYRYRPVWGWIAMGDTAISPFLAFGGIAIAPVAVGAITVGVVSLSLWGVAFGVLAVGSLAFGWWALGFAAVGVRAAVGFAAVARDYAVGPAVSATEAGTVAAMEWVTHQWLGELVATLVQPWPWWLLGCVTMAGILGAWRARTGGPGVGRVR